MAIKITLFITILMYAFVISQSFFYLMAITATLKKMQATSYIETRNLLTKNLETPLQLVYYAALASSLLQTSFSVVNPSGLLFKASFVSLIILVVDVLLAVKGNIPLNKFISSWTSSSYPDNWKDYRNRWFALYHKRQVLNIAGFITLLIGFIFGM